MTQPTPSPDTTPSPSGPSRAGHARPAAPPAAFPPDPDLTVHTDSLARRALRYLTRASVVGIVASLLFHIVTLLVAGFINFKPAQAGGAGQGPADIQLAIVSDAELQELTSDPTELETTASPDVALPELPTLDALEATLAPETPGVSESVQLLANLGGAGDAADAEGIGVTGAGGGAASFFGVEARGTRFAYVVDISGSMAQPPTKLEATKIELTESISALLEHMAFVVILYSGDAMPLGARDRWTDASSEGKRWASNQIEQITARGGTNPMPAFFRLFALRPRPDAIYFMTDGQFDPSVAEELARMNVGARKIPIHCITFVDASGAPLMERIAKDSGGSYSHVDGPR